MIGATRMSYQTALLIALAASAAMLFYAPSVNAQRGNEATIEDVLDELAELRREIQDLRAEFREWKGGPSGIESQPPASAQGASERGPTLEITKVPSDGVYPREGNIGGKVAGVDNTRNYKVVIYSQTDHWYIQPRIDRPLTSIESDSTWGARIFLGHRYGVLLVKSSYKPKAELASLPEIGDDIIARVTVTASD